MRWENATGSDRVIIQRQPRVDSRAVLRERKGWPLTLVYSLVWCVFAFFCCYCFNGLRAAVASGAKGVAGGWKAIEGDGHG